MFGLENQKKKKKYEVFVFDLEKEFKTPKRHSELKKEIEAKVQKVKELLRDGENKEDYDNLGTLLYGYTAVLKVMSRFNAK